MDHLHPDSPQVFDPTRPHTGVAEAAGHAWLTDLKPYMGHFKREALENRLAAGTLAAIAAGYALLFAPRHLSWWAEGHLIMTLGYENALTFVLINLLWIYPQLLTAVHLWRHLVGALAGGSFALLVYLARWAPPRRGAKLPPARLKLYEGRFWPAVLLAMTVCLLGPLVWASNSATWAQFGYLATQSWLVHVMLLDLCLLVAMAPWLVVKDAIARSWWAVKHDSGKLMLGLTMLAAPVIGPAVYLLLRPICTEGPGVWEALRGSVVASSLNPSNRESPLPSKRRLWGTAQNPPGRHSSRAAAPAGPYDGPVTGAAAAGQSSSSIAAASAGLTPWQLPGDVDAAASVPLPSRVENVVPSAVRGAVSSMEAVVKDGWHWLGHKIAAARGGGAPVAAPGEAAGDELDTNGADGGVSGTTSMHHSGGADDVGGNSKFLGPASLGLYPQPVWHNLADGGCELQFDDYYEEDDFDFATDVFTEEEDYIDEVGLWEDSDAEDSEEEDDDDVDHEHRGKDDDGGRAAVGGGLVAAAVKLAEDAARCKQVGAFGQAGGSADPASDGSEGMVISDSDKEEGCGTRRGSNRAAKRATLDLLGHTGHHPAPAAAAGRA
eukprot:gene13417-13545_t